MKESELEYYRQYRNDHPEKVRSARAKYRSIEVNREKEREVARRYRHTHKEALRAKKRTKESRDYHNEYARRRRKEDPEFARRLGESDYRYRRTPSGRAKLLFQTARIRARKTGTVFSLSIEKIQRVIEQGICEATGMPFCYAPRGSHRSPWAPSLDRTVPSLGYVDGNVKVVCWIYNAAKQEFSPGVVVEFAKALLSMEAS